MYVDVNKKLDNGSIITTTKRAHLKSHKNNIALQISHTEQNCLAKRVNSPSKRCLISSFSNVIS